MRSQPYWSEDASNPKNRRGATANLQKIETAAKEHALKASYKYSISYEDISKNALATTKMGITDVMTFGQKVNNNNNFLEKWHLSEKTHLSLNYSKKIPTEKWNTVQDLQGRTYYWNMETNTTQWENPVKCI